MWRRLQPRRKEQVCSACRFQDKCVILTKKNVSHSAQLAVSFSCSHALSAQYYRIFARSHGNKESPDVVGVIGERQPVLVPRV